MKHFVEIDSVGVICPLLIVGEIAIPSFFHKFTSRLIRMLYHYVSDGNSVILATYIPIRIP